MKLFILLALLGQTGNDGSMPNSWGATDLVNAYFFVSFRIVI